MFCLQCDYSLRGLTLNRCPECGRSFDPDDPTTFRDTLSWHWGWPRRLETLGAAICLFDLWLLRSSTGPHDLVLAAVTLASAATGLSGLAVWREKGVGGLVAAVLLLASLWSLVRIGLVHGFVI